MNTSSRLAIIFCAIVFAMLAAPVSALGQGPHNSYQTMSDNFFDFLQQDKPADGIDYLFSTNPALKKVQDQADQLKAQFATLRSIAGPYLSHTLMVETKVAGRYVYQHYFVVYDRQPISIRIKYYRPGSTWMCYGLQFDGNLDDMIQKQADSQLPAETKLLEAH